MRDFMVYISIISDIAFEEYLIRKDKNQFIKFIEFINRTEEMGSRDEKLVFTEKNKDTNKKYKLEYNDEFEEYRFVEI